MRPLLAAIAGLVLLLGCEAGDGSGGYVTYVPGPGFEETMQVWLETPDSGRAPVGRWVTMHAMRQSGPWRLRDSTMTEEPRCEKIRPVTREFEVASKVEWRVEPAGRASYNVPGPPNFERQIRFTQPGRYQVWAVSEGCGRRFESNRVEITVQ